MSAELEFQVAEAATGRNPKSSSAHLLNGVSGFGSTQRYQFQTKTPLRTIAATRKHE